MLSSYNPRLFFVFSVKSIGLHGPAFAVGVSVVDRVGNELDSLFCSFDPRPMLGSYEQEDASFVEHSVIPALPSFTHEGASQFYNAFWNFWLEWRKKNSTVWARGQWPVESNFLSCAVGNNFDIRKHQTPSLFMDMSSLFFAIGRNPLEKCTRLSNELPLNNPLLDARHNARLLLDLLDEI